jgi:S-adenosylmethionine:tRNA ribosyltransferase-isomerase
MRLDEFDYELPEDRIAQIPVEPRDSARMLVDRGGERPEHRHVRDLVDLVRPGDLLVVNDTKVIPARLHLRRASGGAVEVLLLEARHERSRVWEALVRPGGKLRVGEELSTEAGEPLIAMGPRTEAGDTFEVVIRGDDDPIELLARYGETPLPPYITSPLASAARYQTVYAATPGSAAAPTAGLHFTPELLAAVHAAGAELARVELVVGLDTFAPVTEDDPRHHPMHSERYRVPADVLERCRAAERTIAIGTTAVRALESAAAFGELEGRTRLFIHRPYDWRVVDLMMTNFHMPRTTLLMMIDAFVGPRWRTLYDAALAEEYRFLSFGDAMLLDRRAR